MLLHLPRTSPSLPRSLPHPLTLQQSLIHSLLSDVLSHRGPWSYTPSSSLPLRAFKSHARSHLPVASAFNHLTHTHNLLLTFSTRGICRDYFHMKQDKARGKLLTDGSQAEKNKYIWIHIKHVCVSLCADISSIFLWVEPVCCSRRTTRNRITDWTLLLVLLFCRPQSRPNYTCSFCFTALPITTRRDGHQNPHAQLLNTAPFRLFVSITVLQTVFCQCF